MNEKEMMLIQSIRQLLSKERWNDAISVLTDNIRLKSGPEGNKLLLTDLLVPRAYAYTQIREYDLAIDDFNKIIKHLIKNEVPKDEIADAYNHRGYVYYAKEDYDRAISDHSEAIEIHPKFEEAYFDRARAYRKKECYDSAIRDCRKAIELKDTSKNP